MVNIRYYLSLSLSQADLKTGNLVQVGNRLRVTLRQF